MRIFSTLVALFFVVSLSACGTKRADFMTNTASIEPDNQKMWTRPHETTYEIDLEDSMGYADQTVLLGFTIEGDSPATTLKYGFIRFGDSYSGYAELKDLGQLDNIAIGRAIKNAGADGLYITSIESNSTGLWPFYSKRNTTVTGKPLTLKDLGVVGEERYEQRRFWELISGYDDNDAVEQLLSGGESIFGIFGD